MRAAARERAILWFGIALIAAGVICNEWLLARAFSTDGALLLTNRIIIWAFDLGALFAGLLLIVLRKRLSEERFLFRLLKSHPRFAALLLGIFFSIVILSLAEAAFYLVLKYGQADEAVREGEYAAPGYSVQDSLLGYVPRPGARVSSILRRGDRVVYDVVYTIDEESRRVTPVDGREGRGEFALFFGCSCTFGEGVNDDQTLPYHFGRLSTEQVPYNYGFHGYGPQQMLAKLESGTLAAELDSDRGMLVYAYLVGHEERAVGSMRVYNGWGIWMPYYTVGATGELVRRGDFTTGRPLRSMIYKLLGMSQILKFFEFNYPFRISDAEYELTARIIERSAELYEETFGNDRFYVAVLPTIDRDLEILPYLEKAGIKYFDYSRLYDPKDDSNRIVGDGHPAPQSYERIAARLVGDIAEVELPGT